MLGFLGPFPNEIPKQRMPSSSSVSLRHISLLLLVVCSSPISARDMPPHVDLLHHVVSSDPFSDFESAMPPFTISATQFSRTSAIPLFRSMDYCYAEPWKVCTAPKPALRRVYDSLNALIMIVWWMVSSAVGFWSRGLVQRVEKRLGRGK
ncbi:hypothetical protein BJ741DRAFT_629187 [Chytriomyces cf. hyalinus JEL632]|nr:hypothetical protein BJ741DRAFT_629187 [Chytriomyces cf. hyalinus JEL632]